MSGYNFKKNLMTKFTPNFIVWLAILFSLLAYGFIYTTKRMPTGDETIAYLCATGNQGAYEAVNKHGGIYGKITNAPEWQHFFEVRDAAWSTIAADLTQTDLHPPLYFWLLHQVLKLVKPMFLGGLLLNLLLHLLSVYLLYHLSKAIGLAKRTAAMVLLFWCLSPAILSIGFSARQYELLSAINITAALAFVKFENNKHPLWLVLFLIGIAAGVLTHYLYLYFMLAYVGYAMFIKKDGRLIVITLVLMLLAVASLYALHPGVIAQFTLQQARAQVFDVSIIPMRVGKVLISFIQIVLPVLSLKPLLLKLPVWLVSVGAIALQLTLFLALRNKRLNQYLLVDTVTNKNKLISWLLWCSLLLAIVPYLLFFTPLHAMGGQYLVLVYPFLLLTLVPWLSANTALSKLVVVFFLMGIFMQLIWLNVQQQGYNKLFQDIEHANVICINSTDRRGFLRLVPYLKKQVVLMDEQVKPCELISEGKLFFIADQATKSNARAYLFEANEYDLYDGVVFYTQVIDVAFCGQLHGK